MDRRFCDGDGPVDGDGDVPVGGDGDGDVPVGGRQGQGGHKVL